tara:strand:- start:4560 stop:4889 length:330 start_codon:yes stop_codon:yes gene_type:complete
MGMIVGNVLDKEYNNEPLLYANISIKGTSIQSTSDITGLFHIENLPDGDYTLICGFIGYDTKEVKVHVSAAQPAEVKIPLAASTVSLNELAALDNIAIRNDKTSVASNK